MTADHTIEDTEVNEQGMVMIPTPIRRRLDIEAGDRLRWTADEDGQLSVEVVKQRCGTFDDFEPVEMGGDSSETHDLTGHETT